MSPLSFISATFLAARRRPPVRTHSTCPRARARAQAHAAPSQPTPGTLFLVPTPIGNSRDITLRACDVLSTVDVIAAEDTRTARSLLRILNCPASAILVSCHEHNWRSRIPPLLSHLQLGRTVALVSEAGTPCVSDPGTQVVAAAVAAGYKVVPLPGPCAAVSALVASALPSLSFTFVGFLPRSGEARRKAIEQLSDTNSTVVLYEAPHRLLSTLNALRTLDGPGRPCCLAREMTKKYEQFLRFDSIADAFHFYENHQDKPRGEFTLVLAPPPVQHFIQHDLTTYPTAPVQLPVLVESLIKSGISVSTVAKSVSASCEVPKKLVYAYATKVKEKLLFSNEPNST